jgi:hypothetical protein
MKSVAMLVQHASRIIPMRIEYNGGVPSIVEGRQHASVADTNVGIATITFRYAFARLPMIVATAVSPTGEKMTAHIRDVTAEGFILETINEAGANADADSHILIVGFDSADEA